MLVLLNLTGWDAMETTTLTSKGQLVIPKAIRDALHLAPGTRFSVTLDQGRIVLEANSSKWRQLGDWLPALQIKREASLELLTAPVDGYKDA